MNEEKEVIDKNKNINQLESLIEDRKSFINADQESSQEFVEDVRALQWALSEIKDRNKTLSTQDKLKKIINYYGIDDQLKYIHSEYFELDEAILRREQLPSKNQLDGEMFGESYCVAEAILHIEEEIADVMVMLKQFQYYYDISDEDIKEAMDKKIERQLRRIKLKEELKEIGGNS